MGGTWAGDDPLGSTRSRRLPVFLVAAAATALTLLVMAAPALAERTYESNIEGFSSANGITTDGLDNVWIADTGTGVISKYNSFPSETKEAEQGGEGHFGGNLRSLAFDNPLNRLYVADSGPVVVDLYEHGDGPFIEQWSTENSCGLDYVAVDNSGGATQGRVYIARSCSGPQHLQAFKSNHEAADFSGSAGYISENHITGTPFGEIGEISGIATDVSGNFYIADRTNNVIDEFAPSGLFVQEINGTGVPGGFSSVAGVAVDPTNDNVLVVDQGKNVVDEFESSGTFLEQLTGTGPSEGTAFGSLPGGITVNSSGYVYVSAGSAVDIFSPNAILPKVTYQPVTNQTQTSGTLNASIDLNAGPEVTSCSFQYGTTTSYGSSVPCSPATPYTSNKSVSAEISGLTTEDIYHYRVVLVTANGTKKANDQTFIPHAVAGLATQPATNVERNTATVNGSFNGNGEETHYLFEWGTSDSYGNKTPVEDAGSPTTPQLLSANLSGLTVETTYHFRVVATNAVGTSFGSDQTFKTLAAVEELSTEPASNITASTATINASYIGINEDVHYYFEWGSNTEYGNVTAAPPSDDGVQTGHRTLSFNLSDLGVDQPYHYRVIAIDNSGETVGADQTFTTLGSYQFSTSFGSTGAGDGQMSHPEDVAVDNSNGDIYVADIGNHRVDKFDSSGQFLAAWGWGVASGAAESQVCTSGCQIGLSGTGVGQFQKPTFVEVDNSTGSSAGDVYVADTGDDVVAEVRPVRSVGRELGEQRGDGLQHGRDDRRNHRRQQRQPLRPHRQQPLQLDRAEQRRPLEDQVAHQRNLGRRRQTGIGCSKGDGDRHQRLRNLVREHGIRSQVLEPDGKRVLSLLDRAARVRPGAQPRRERRLRRLGHLHRTVPGERMRRDQPLPGDRHVRQRGPERRGRPGLQARRRTALRSQ